MLRKILPLCLILAFCVGIFACEEPDPETVAKIIKSATTVAFGKVLDNNPELTDTFLVFALINKEIIIERTIDPEKAKELMYDILEFCRDMEEEDQQLVLTLFNTILPLIELPEEGLLKEPQRTYMISFFSGIQMAAENKRAIEGPEEPPPVSWEVWLREETKKHMQEYG